MKNFWQLLPRPIVVLAPMADVTDPSFRRMIAKYSAHPRRNGTIGGPDVMWTEFVSADGLLRATPEGKEKLRADLQYHESERPIVAQLFSSTEEYMEAAARLCLELGFDGVDINMGCPDRSIERQGCGANMIRNPEKARAIIRAAKRGARSKDGGIPVSVKTRLGYNQDQVEEWIPEVLAETPAALTVHARTRKEMSKVPARWERVTRVVELRDQLSPETLVLGNGDVLSLADAYEKIATTKADGAMLGRAIFGNPWLFHPEKDFATISIAEKLGVLVEHTYLFRELLPHKSFAVMKKHYKAYVRDFPGATDLRQTLMEQVDPEGVARVVEQFLKNQP